eukprot:TRINITY_DN178_c0_g7_i1.p1 TRINITY_DN178_c0_g7~~TRINITY_DN178_c0_g7_i1.p1  ORF type:complete len:514 (+),score=65.54 TRINITY_DN178_c0_g7_i1:46-1587(+)
MPWYSAGMQIVEAFEPLALLQLIQAKYYHRESLQQEREFHKESLAEGFSIHEKEMAKASEITQRELQEANRIHREAMAQAKDYHKKDVRLNNELLERDHELANCLHDISMWAQQYFHLDNKSYTLKLFTKELQHAQNVSRKENIRDNLVQESQRAQATMIVNTLMFGCCFAVMIEGNLPDGTPETVVICFSLALACSLGFLVISVWFAMNLQGRIAKYRISDPNVRYGRGKSRTQHETFHSYFQKHCKPVYRLTQFFLWLGTLALLVCGGLLMGSKFAITHNSPWGAAIFIIIQSFLIFAMAVLLVTYNPKLGVAKEDFGNDERDFAGFQAFVKEMEDELKSHAHECPKCRMPMNIMVFCPSTGERHETNIVCNSCNLTKTKFKYCPATGIPHELDTQQQAPFTKKTSHSLQPLHRLSHAVDDDARMSGSLPRFFGAVHSPHGTVSNATAPPADMHLSPHHRVHIDHTPPSSPFVAPRLSPLMGAAPPAIVREQREMFTPPHTPPGSPLPPDD